MHEGHRERLVGKVKENGIVYEHEVMEILLFNACPRRDVNAVAHDLITSFHGINGVFNANVADLLKVKGVGKNMAEYVAVLGKALGAVREKDCFDLVPNNYFFKNYILSRPAVKSDCLELHCIDKDGRVRRVCVLEPNATPFLERGSEILRLISLHSPYGVYADKRFAGKAPQPDRADDEFSERLYDIVKLCGGSLYDYSIVGGDGGYYSYKMSDRGVFGSKKTGGANG